jgi:hypothetical protein
MSGDSERVFRQEYGRAVAVLVLYRSIRMMVRRPWRPRMAWNRVSSARGSRVDDASSMISRSASR